MEVEGIKFNKSCRYFSEKAKIKKFKNKYLIYENLPKK
jgi:hypothetical protein